MVFSDEEFRRMVVSQRNHEHEREAAYFRMLAEFEHFGITRYARPKPEETIYKAEVSLTPGSCIKFTLHRGDRTFNYTTEISPSILRDHDLHEGECLRVDFHGYFQLTNTLVFSEGSTTSEEVTEKVEDVEKVEKTEKAEKVDLDELVREMREKQWQDIFDRCTTGYSRSAAARLRGYLKKLKFEDDTIEYAMAGGFSTWAELLEYAIMRDTNRGD